MVGNLRSQTIISDLISVGHIIPKHLPDEGPLLVTVKNIGKHRESVVT